MGFFGKKTAGNNVEDFDEVVRDLMRRHAPDGITVEESDDDALLTGGHRTYLGNMRQHWSELEPEMRVPWLEQVVASMFDPATGPGDELDVRNLRAGVRSRAMTELTQLHFAQQSSSPEDTRIPTRAIGGDLLWCLIWDEPQLMQLINEGQLRDWEPTFDELLEIGIANLAEEPIQGWGAIDNRVFSPIDTDDYCGSRVFLPGALDQIPLVGDVVIFHPTRTSLYVAPSDDAEAIHIAAQLTLEQANNSNQVSLSPIVGRDGNWQPLVLDESHVAYNEWKLLTILDQAAIYDGQKQLLQDLFEEELFVASFVPMQPDGAAVTSQSVWTETVPTLLPHTELLALFSPETEDAIIVPWQAATDIVGHLMEPTEHYPARTRVLEFPTDEEMRRLAVHAIPM